MKQRDFVETDNFRAIFVCLSVVLSPCRKQTACRQIIHVG